MTTLALDTALSACGVAVVDGETTLATAISPMERGHQEALAPLVQKTMAEAGTAFDALDRIVVTVGPGSFTGLRVGLAFAKALALALGKPCIGIGTLEALSAGAPHVTAPAFTASVIDARREQLYLQCFAGGVALMAPDHIGADVAAARLAELWNGGPALITGPGARLLEGVLPAAVVETKDWCDPVALARLGAAKPVPTVSPRPLYLRAPDARTIAERAADAAAAGA